MADIYEWDVEDEEFWEEVLRREPLLIGISSGETDR